MAAYASDISWTPPLENGDRLTRAEFERRYEAAPPGLKAELIEGVVYVASPVGIPHAQAHGAITRWLSAFLTHEPSLDMLIEPTIRLDADNEVQPDVAVARLPIVADPSQFVTHPPELAIEVSASSVSYDLGVKMNVYRRNGVQEYIVWRVYDRAVDWFELKDGAYAGLEGDARGIIESRVFPGLRLDVKALLAGDLAAVLAELA